jgi:hypothetical protein
LRLVWKNPPQGALFGSALKPILQAHDESKFSHGISPKSADMQEL